MNNNWSHIWIAIVCIRIAFTIESTLLLITRVLRKFIIRGESWSISALVCTRFGFIPTIYLPRLNSTLIEERENKRESDSTSDWWSSGKRRSAHRPTGIKKHVGRVNTRRAHRISCDKSKGFNQPLRWGKNEAGRLVLRLHSSRSHHI